MEPETEMKRRSQHPFASLPRRPEGKAPDRLPTGDIEVSDGGETGSGCVICRDQIISPSGDGCSPEVVWAGAPSPHALALDTSSKTVFVAPQEHLYRYCTADDAV